MSFADLRLAKVHDDKSRGSRERDLRYMLFFRGFALCVLRFDLFLSLKCNSKCKAQKANGKTKALP
jgi:hypothetical protein